MTEQARFPPSFCTAVVSNSEWNYACTACQRLGAALTEGVVRLAGRWQSQERAQLLKGKKLHERQVELEDALIDLKVSS